MSFVVAISDQESDVSEALLGYARPRILRVYSTLSEVSPRGSTNSDEGFRMLVNVEHSGLGCECGSSVHVNFGGKRLLPDPVLSRELGASERIAFALPHLVDNERAMDIPLSIEVTSSDGSSQRSTEYLWQYEAPAIEQVHLSAGPAVGINILTIIGRNFGGERNLNSTGKTTNSIVAGGEVLLLSGDGSEACSTCYLPKADTGRSYITSWSHTRITAFYTGNFGVIKVLSGGRAGRLHSPEVKFNNTSPSIVAIVQDQSIPTIGGTNITLWCKECFGNRKLLEVKIGEKSQVNNDCQIVHLEYPVADPRSGDPTTMIQCIAPPGHSSAAEVIVVRGTTLRSLEQTHFVSYMPPEIDFIQQDSVPTVGGKIVLKGSNFGESGVAVVTLSSSLIEYSREIRTILAEGSIQLHNGVEFNVPCGAGAGPIRIDLRVGDQVATSTIASGYTAPNVVSVSPLHAEKLSTAGSFKVKIEGRNFVPLECANSSQFSNCTSVTISDTRCAFRSTTFERVICEVPAGVGKDLDVSINVCGQEAGFRDFEGGPEGIVGETSFSYPPPSIIAVSRDSFPTSGIYSNGTRAVLRIHGEKLWL